MRCAKQNSINMFSMIKTLYVSKTAVKAHENINMFSEIWKKRHLALTGPLLTFVMYSPPVHKYSWDIYQNINK